MVVASAGRVRPGALQPGTARSIVVISDDGEPAVALRERIDPHFALIRDVRPGEVGVAIRACRPFPWLIIGAGAAAAAVLRTATLHPTLLLWRRPVPVELRERAIAFDRFIELSDRVERALAREVGGMRLAVGEGIVMPDGRCVSAPRLEALIAAHPGGLALKAPSRRSVATLLGRHGAEVRLVSLDPATVALR